jgi:hypothetical protein
MCKAYVDRLITEKERHQVRDIIVTNALDCFDLGTC